MIIAKNIQTPKGEKMELEIVEFYPKKQNGKPKNKYYAKFLGTMHIYLPDIGADIRGISVFRAGRFFFFKMPSQMYLDDETGKKKTYPVLAFTKPEDQKNFIDLLIKRGTEYVNKFLKDQAA